MSIIVVHMFDSVNSYVHINQNGNSNSFKYSYFHQFFSQKFATYRCSSLLWIVKIFCCKIIPKQRAQLNT